MPWFAFYITCVCFTVSVGALSSSALSVSFLLRCFPHEQLRSQQNVPEYFMLGLLDVMEPKPTVKQRTFHSFYRSIISAFTSFRASLAWSLSPQCYCNWVFDSEQTSISGSMLQCILGDDIIIKHYSITRNLVETGFSVIRWNHHRANFTVITFISW